MKNTALTKLLVATLALSVVITTGCRSKRPDKNITPIPGVAGGAGPEAGAFGNPVDDNNSTDANTTGRPDNGIGVGPTGGGPDMVNVNQLPEVPPFDPNAPGARTDMTGYTLDENGMLQDTDAFKANTIYFNYDSSVVGSAEIVKLDEIITILRSQAGYKLRVEGHCDERGTEEYNRALGERRANSIRDHLMSAGVGPDRIRTLSWGEDQPADFGHDETAWAQNRRAEFILLRPAN